MRARDRFGLGMGALLLRVLVGVIFIWAGLAKVLPVMDYSPEQTAMLANMGVSIPAPASPGAPGASTDAPRPPDRPLPASSGGGSSGGGAWRGDRAGTLVLAMAQAPGGAGSGSSGSSSSGSSSGAKVFTAADFPGGSRLRPLYNLALLLRASAAPGPGGRAGIVPASIGNGSAPVYLAWAAAITEVGAGVLVLVGLFTRLAALSLAGVMVVAAWLTQIGPAVNNADAAFKPLLGFLPLQAWTDIAKMGTLNLQFALFMAALALVFMGAGGASIDALLGSAPKGPAKPAPKPAA